MTTDDGPARGGVQGYGDNFAQAERRALADLLDRVGPTAPTLCAGWTTSDLALHLVVRESQLLTGVAMVLPPTARWARARRDGVRRMPYAVLVHRIRTGPPPLSPLRLGPVDRAVNTVEMFVHHEDVRRAQPGWEPRALTPQLEDELWRRLRRAGRLLFRRVRVGVLLSHPDGLLARVRGGEPTVVVTGPPGELLLYAAGRREVAAVRLSGPDAAVAALRDARLRI